MKRLSSFALGVAVAALIGCGDNNKECGDGTHLEDGYCVADDVIVPTCGDGTILNEDTNTCVIDESTCQGGTVLIAGQCVDPTEGLEVDVTEGAEPNGFDFIEASAEPAGIFTIKPIGGTTVISGTIDPHPDANDDSRPEPDVDTYVFEASGPSLLEISADGTSGLAGFFLVAGLVTDEDELPLVDYVRIGINLTGDTAKRQLFIPQAGVYALVITDRRTFEFGEGVGGENAKYFISVQQKEITATSLTLTDGQVQTIGTIADAEVDFYSVPWGTGLSQVQLDVFDAELEGELVVSSRGALRGTDPDDPQYIGLDPVPPNGPANLVFAAANDTFVAVDYVVNTTAAAVDYRFRARTTTATAAPTDGSDATVTSPSDLPFDAIGGLDVSQLGWFTINATANQYLGTSLAFDTLVSARLFDEHGQNVASFTNLDLDDAFTDYNGLLRLAATGTYYLAVFAPADPPETDVTLTSTFAPVTPDALVFDTAVTGVESNAFNSNVFTYDAGAEPWQLATLTANAMSGGARVRFIAVNDAYGMLDDLDSVNGVSADPTGLAIIAPANGTGSGGFLPPKLGTLVAIVNTANAAGTFGIDTEERTYTDLGEQDAGYTSTLDNQTIPNLATTPTDQVRYLIKTDPDNSVLFSATPQALLDVDIRCLTGRESSDGSSTSGGAGVAEIVECFPTNDGYVAFEVSANGLVLGTFDLDIEIAGPRTTPDGFYSFSAGTTPWMNICSLASADVTPLDRDDGLTPPITLPAGFAFYGVNVTQFVASTNGWISFDTTTSDPAYWLFDTIPSPFWADMAIAPFWGDLVGVRVCTQQIGGKQYVQWRGTDIYAAEDASVMLVLDSATDTIEFVYPPYFSAFFGAIGVQEDFAEGQEYIPTDDLAGTSVLLTPM